MKRIVLFTFFLLTIGQVFADDCVFDPSSADGSFLTKNPHIKYHAWDDKTKEARAILKDGSFLYVKKWACRHVGMDARLMAFYGKEKIEKDDVQLKRVRWFGSQVLDKSDFKNLGNSILNKTYSREIRPNGYILRIPHGTYSEFYVELTTLNDMQVIAIVYYFS